MKINNPRTTLLQTIISSKWIKRSKYVRDASKRIVHHARRTPRRDATRRREQHRSPLVDDVDVVVVVVLFLEKPRWSRPSYIVVGLVTIMDHRPRHLWARRDAWSLCRILPRGRTVPNESLLESRRFRIRMFLHELDCTFRALDSVAFCYVNATPNIRILLREIKLMTIAYIYSK